MKAKWMGWNGTVNVTSVPASPPIGELQKFVEGYVQIILTSLGDFICNEDAGPMGLPINEEASMLLQEAAPDQKTVPLRGNVLLLTK